MKRWNNHQYRHVRKTREALERKHFLVFNVDDSRGRRYLLALGPEGAPTLLVMVKCACKYRDEDVEDWLDAWMEEMCAALPRSVGVARELWVWQAYRARPTAVRRAW